MPHDLMPSAESLAEIDPEFFTDTDEHEPSVLSLMKSAGRSLVKTAKRVRKKSAILALMLAAGAALVAPQAAQGQGIADGCSYYYGILPSGDPGYVCAGQANAPTPSTQGSPAGLPGNPTAGDPVDVATGNVFLAVTDYKSFGQNPLELIRYYNSMNFAGNQPVVTTYALILGSTIAGTENWRTNYDRYLKISPASSPTSVVVERPDGQQITFTGSGSTWTTRSDVDYTLTHSGSTWKLTDHNDTVESYTDLGTGEGQLNTITLRNGYQQNLSYYPSGALDTVTDSYSRTLTFNYNSSALLQTVTTPDSLVLNYGYYEYPITGVFQLRTVSYYTGSTFISSQTYNYNDPNNGTLITSITDENGNTSVSWTYDYYSRALTSQQGNLGSSPLNANLTSFSYSSSGTTTTTAVTNAFGSSGVTDTYTFQPNFGVQKVTSISRAATSTTAAATESFGYDGYGYTNSSTDWNDGTNPYRVTTLTNNAYGLPTAINEASSSGTTLRSTAIGYGAATGACTTFVRLPCSITLSDPTTTYLTSTFAYDGNGNPTSRTDTDETTNTVPYSTYHTAREFQWSWNSTGQETSFQLPRTDVTAKTTFGYTGGTLTSITDPLSHVTSIGYGTTNPTYPTTITDPNGTVTTLGWDARLNLNTSTLATTAGNLVTTWTHDPANNLTALELPNGAKLTYGLDSANRLTSVTDLIGNTLTYTLDQLGDVKEVQTKNPSGTVTFQDNATFDALGREFTNTNGVSQTTTYAWDVNSNLTKVTPPSPSGATSFGYDVLNRLLTKIDPTGGGTTTLTYNAYNQPLTVQDPNAFTTSYVYDGFAELIQSAPPVCCVTVNYYDGDRNLSEQIKPGPRQMNATYDALDRPLTRTFASDTSLNQSFTYDATSGHGYGIGHLTTANDKIGSVAFTWDQRGNVTLESRNMPGIGYLNTTTTFDAGNNISSITYPKTNSSAPAGTLVTYTRDSMGEVETVAVTPPGASSATNVATSIFYQPELSPGAIGRDVAGMTYGNGITGAYGFDKADRSTTRVDTGTGGAVLSLSNGYYNDSTLFYINDYVNAANTQSFSYDALQRITGAAATNTGGYGDYYWSWDANGNMHAQTIGSQTTFLGLTSGTNRLSSLAPTGGTTTNITSSSTGNLGAFTAGSTTLLSLGYNQANELSSAATTTSSATYAYDFRGQRLEKAVSGSNTVAYQFSLTGGELLTETDFHGGQVADYIYLDPGRNSRPIGEVNPTTGAIYYTHTDYRGAVEKLTSSSQATAWSALYNPFGDIAAANIVSSIGTQSLRLPGQYFDPETCTSIPSGPAQCLNHNGFRDYAGTLTRYVESDPIGLNAGTNTYQYVKGNPFKYTDRRGLDPNDASGGGGSAAPCSGAGSFGAAAAAVGGSCPPAQTSQSDSDPSDNLSFPYIASDPYPASSLSQDWSDLVDGPNAGLYCQGFAGVPCKGTLLLPPAIRFPGFAICELGTTAACYLYFDKGGTVGPPMSPIIRWGQPTDGPST